MFKRRTLFIVGAGASAEVEMPVGSQLAKTIGAKCDIRFERGFHPTGIGDHALFGQFRGARSNISGVQTAAWLIRDGIQLSSSIDDFLDLHRDNSEVILFGKSTIVKSILEAEQNSLLYFDRARETTIDFDKIAETWFVKFMKILARGQTLGNVAQILDNVSFIIFNYDRCLEYFLLHALQRLYGLDQSRAEEICNGLRVIHPYGVVGKLPSSGHPGVPFGASSANCVALAPGIRTYTEQIADANEISFIHEEVGLAESIVFVGFAYHDQNMLLLTPKQPLEHKPVYGTAYGMSDDDTAVVKRQLASMFIQPMFVDTNSIAIKNDLTGAQLFDYFAKSLAGNSR
jgi:hypothetical protein